MQGQVEKLQPLVHSVERLDRVVRLQSEGLQETLYNSLQNFRAEIDGSKQSLHDDLMQTVQGQGQQVATVLDGLTQIANRFE